MGQLFYGNVTEPIQIPDRLLAHVRIITTTKLRRSESFTLSWRHPDCDKSALSTIWMQPAIPLRFVFDADPAAVDQEILHRLASAANTSKGLILDLDMFADAASESPVRAVEAA